MTTRSAITTAALVFLFTGPAVLAQTDAPSHLATTPEATIAAAEAQSVPGAHSGVRIVRLSQVKGEVKLDRNVTGNGTQEFENAFANLPITQGATLKTESGVAEVEFEDNSTLRLTPDTTIEFTELRRDPSGLTASSVKVLQGTLFVSMAPNKGNQFTLISKEGKFAFTLISKEGKFAVAPETRVHFHVGDPVAGSKTTLAVLDGSVQAQVGSTTMTAAKKTTLMFDPANAAAPTLVSHLDKTPYDAWDKGAVDYHKHYMNYSRFSGTGTGSPVYGLNDMNYYGNFSDAGGCGSMWRPYLASANWDPYSNGTLAYYPNAGYSWVSPYPWGWMPYHSGSWMNCPGTGWGWQPGGNFTGLTNTSAPILKKHGINLPPAPPRPGHGRLVAVNTRPVPASGFADKGTFVFSKDSAGLGVPRATFGNLNGVSKSVLQHGAVSAPAYSAPVSFTTQAGQRSISFARAGANPAMSSPSSSSSAGWSGSAASSSFASSTASTSVMSSGSSHAGGASMGGASAGSGGGHH